MINNIPSIFLKRSGLFGEIRDLSDKYPNDMELGKAVRNIMNDYRDGKYNPPSDIEFDTKDKK